MELLFVCLAAHDLEFRRWIGGVDRRICQTFSASPAEPGELLLGFSALEPAGFIVSRTSGKPLSPRPFRATRPARSLFRCTLAIFAAVRCAASSHRRALRLPSSLRFSEAHFFHRTPQLEFLTVTPRFQHTGTLAMRDSRGRGFHLSSPTEAIRSLALARGDGCHCADKVFLGPPEGCNSRRG